MRTVIKSVFLTLISLSSFLCSSSETIRIAAEEWPPFSSADLKHYGVMNHIISESFALENVKVEFGFFPAVRALNNVKIGEWDGIGAWTPNEERARDYHFSDTLFEENIVFFHLKNYPFDWKIWDDLKDLEIGQTRGYYNGDEFSKALKEGKLNIQVANNDQINFKKLLHRRINIFPANLDAGLDLLNSKFKKEDRDSITYHPLPVDQGPLVLMLSRKNEKNKRMLILFNKGLKRLRESGLYDQFFEESRQGKYIK